MPTSSAHKHRRKAKFRGRFFLAAGLLLASLAAAGEATVAKPSTRAEYTKVPPALLLSVDAEEPESLPAASEALERLLYDLGKQRRLFSRVSADGYSTGDEVRQLRLEVVLHRRGVNKAHLKSLWPPITQREPDGPRLLFSGQLPLEAHLRLVDQRTKEVRAEKQLVVQSKGRTLTAGTTDAAGIILARDIKKYLREQHRSGVF